MIASVGEDDGGTITSNCEFVLNVISLGLMM
ncbi:hypothetical protein Echvi_3074 [Echinicola vietnamensis DSM 17526]|uniref:Uncharacterized protein n=1 Tax=Echinicola vietnamensis (strain DSM 17526 / LMG 23754 / KMM 6221) TaxID=926556 RepID=L0G182_ECHVK|nr:hypothetical protein Echvi_3074 [Echinicola vietnamensis DSM 17526]